MTIYADYNATAPVRPQVRDVIAEILYQPMNPSSVHAFGRVAKKYIEDARRVIGEAVSAFPNEVIFVGSGTEANAMALRGFPGKTLIASAVEHSSVLKYADHLIPVDHNGVVDIAALDALLKEKPDALVSVMLANNETGVIQPVAEVAKICKQHGVLLHVDAVQGLGKLVVDFTALGADMMSIAGHKMGGAVGAASLIVRQDLAIAPLFIGGGQEKNRRAGTENVAAIAGFAKAIELIDLSHMQQCRRWLDELEASRDNMVILGKDAPRLPNTTCLALPHLTQEVALMKLDIAGYAVSAGSACSSGRVEPSHVLLAMGIDPKLAGSAIRLSIGWQTVEDDVIRLREALASL